MRFLDTILNIVFPVHCLGCGKSGTDLCMACLGNAPGAERESAKWIFPIYDYRHPSIKKALWLLKYKGKKRLAGIFAEAMYGVILEELSELHIMENFREPILIPIPLSKKRYRERGYNQAELICRELEKLFNEQRKFSGEFWSGESVNILPVMIKDILIKPKDTKRQAHIENRKERLKNIIGSFAVKNPETIKGRNIILIDDILTTGATLNEARKILKQHGARKVIAFTVAH